MNSRQILVLTIILAISYACKSPSNKANNSRDTTAVEMVMYNNPPAEGFDVEGSHPIAILLADQVMNAMGGRAQWDETKVIHWNFFGKRTLLWDKENNRVRIDIPNSGEVIVLNMNDKSGKAWINEKEVEESQLDECLDKAYRIWVNDSYWLFMPFKLKDSGVTLTYDREEQALSGESCDVLRLTFEEVGITPQNAYEVYVGIDDRLIKQWAYFKNSTDENPQFINPWDNYQEYGGIKLASGRGDREITDIKVLEKIPPKSFESPNPIKW